MKFSLPRVQGLRTHLTVMTAAAVASAIIAASLVIFFSTRQQLIAQMDDTLTALARQAEPRERPFAGEFEIVFDSGRLSGERGIAQFVTAEGSGLDPFEGLSLPDDLDLGGFDFLRPQPFVPIGDRARAVAAGTAPDYFENVDVRRIPMRMLTKQVAPGLAVQVAQPLDEINAVLSRTAWTLLLVALLGAAVAAVLGRAIAGSAVRRVGQVTAVAEEVAETRSFGRRLNVEGKDELSRLAATFNEMLDALEKSIGSQKQLVADASHELRTPLTSIRTNIEVLGKASLPEAERARLLVDVEAQVAELSDLITNIVELARNGDRPRVVEEVSVDRVVLDAIERAKRRNPMARFEVDVETWTIQGDAASLGRAIDNVLENALKYGTTEAPIEVRIADGQLLVRDYGPGIGDDDLPHVFDRFYRASAARNKPGSGLGLAIVHDVVERHGGEVSITNAEGGGVRVRIELPEGARA